MVRGDIKGKKISHVSNPYSNSRDIGFHFFLTKKDAQQFIDDYFSPTQNMKLCKFRVKGFNTGGYFMSVRSETWERATLLKVYR